MVRTLAVAVYGQIIYCNDGTYTPVTTYSITTTITINSITNRGCKIIPQSGQTTIFNVNAGNNELVSFGALDIDGQNSVASLITAAPNATYTINFANTRLKDPTSYGLTQSGSGQFTVTGSVECSMSSALSCLNQPSMTAGGLNLTSLTGTVTERVASNGLFSYFDSAALGPIYNISYLNITGNPANDSSIHYLIRVRDTSNVRIDLGGGAVAMNSVSTTTSCRPILIDNSTTVSALSADNGTIRNGTLRPNCAGGGHAGATIGFDGDPGIYRDMANNGVIEQLTVIAGANVNSTNITEGLFCGYQTNCTIRRSNITGLYDALEFKGCTGCYGYSNVGTLLTKNFTTLKYGSGNYIYNNLHYETTNISPAVTCFVNLNDGGTGSPTTGNFIGNNSAAYYVAVANTRRFICQSGTGNTATFNHNNWYNQGGLSAGFPFQYLGVTYASVAAWTAIEATATGVVPYIQSFSQGLYGMTPSSSLGFTGGTLPAAIINDYYGNPFLTTPSVGAVQYTGPDLTVFPTLSANNVWTGTNQFAAGSADSPGIMTGESGTGFYRSAAGILDWCTGGTCYIRERATQLQVGNGISIGWSTTAGVATMGPAFSYGSSTAIKYNLNFYGTAAVPTISSCGTSPPTAHVGSTNQAGQFTLGTGTPTACTITFANAYLNAAFCTVTPAFNYTGTYYISAQSKTAFTITLGTGTDSVVFNYNCQGS